MHLFEVTNGYLGESYVRVYVWAADEATALLLAKETYQARDSDSNFQYTQKPATYWENLKCVRLFSAGDTPFCTLPDDSGWETEKIRH
jgi:hypothetical protein